MCFYIPAEGFTVFTFLMFVRTVVELCCFNVTLPYVQGVCSTLANNIGFSLLISKLPLYLTIYTQLSHSKSL